MKLSRVPAILAAAIASGIAMWAQSLIRDVWQIRSLPERVMEWALLFVPLDAFERGVEQFGSSAKELALTGTVIGMALILLVLGYLILRRGNPWYAVAAAPGLWLLGMAVIMPITGGGLFGSGLFQPAVLVNTAYLAVFVAYSAALATALYLNVVIQGRNSKSAATIDPALSRRVFALGLLGTIGTWALAAWTGRGGTQTASDLPLAPAPVPTAAPVSPTAGAVGASAPPTLVAAPTGDPLPVPPLARKIDRDKDGSLTAAGRSPGTLADQVTPLEQHYVVTKNAVADPVVDGSTWRLVIDGEVQNPIQLDYRTLRQLPSVETVKTLECISNFTAKCELTSFGCDLISTSRWKGVTLSDIIGLAGGLKPTAQGLAVLSVDEFSAGLPLEIIQDPETILVYEMDGQVLPREHGYPARLIVPGRYGMKNPKWVAAIRPVASHYLDWYEQRNWDKDGIIKTMSRIDVPASGTTVPAGPQRVVGIAYAGNRGIRAVELSADGGSSWAPTRFIEPATGPDAWVRWEASVSLQPGHTVTLVVRATDGTGETQTDEFKLPQPDGGSGQHSITLNIA